MCKRKCHIVVALLLFILPTANVFSQEKPNPVDSLLNKKKGIWKLAHGLRIDTAEPVKIVERNDEPFEKYTHKIIRNIYVDRIEFGVSLADTSKKMQNRLTRFVNTIHATTHIHTIKNHLFFKENEPLSPYVMGHNERYLRDLSFIQDAKIDVLPLWETVDSVDILVRTKDLISLVGSLNISNTKKGIATVFEDNISGSGDRLQFSTLYHIDRSPPWGGEVQYTRRNIRGSFINLNLGYSNFRSEVRTALQEEQAYFVKMEKPFVNPFMTWTYALAMELHRNKNFYHVDSFFLNNIKYQNTLFDSWVGYNLSSQKRFSNDAQKLRFLIAARIMASSFSEKPLRYYQEYNFAYANTSSLLLSASAFKQNFYSTRFIYGFGRKEDIPTGMDVRLTTGITHIEERTRPYLGLSFERYGLTRREGFYHYTIRTEGFKKGSVWEDINALGQVEYFTRLYRATKPWKHRIYINASLARQLRTVFNEPLYIESQYGLQRYNNNYAWGSLRHTVNAEWVLFTRRQFLYFKLATFIGGGITAFKTYAADSRSKYYPVITGGIRARNESISLGTLEFRAMYFPVKDYLNHWYVLRVSTNLRFKYNQDYVKRPGFIQIN